MLLYPNLTIISFYIVPEVINKGSIYLPVPHSKYSKPRYDRHASLHNKIMVVIEHIIQLYL